MEYEQFKGTVWKQGDSLVITIPANIIKFSGIEINDDVRVMIQKIKKEDDKDGRTK